MRNGGVIEASEVYTHVPILKTGAVARVLIAPVAEVIGAGHDMTYWVELMVWNAGWWDLTASERELLLDRFVAVAKEFQQTEVWVPVDSTFMTMLSSPGAIRFTKTEKKQERECVELLRFIKDHRETLLSDGKGRKPLR
jgi:hypothetical protein